jgi:hypothetical protein
MNSKVLSVLILLSFIIVIVLVLPLGIAPNTVGSNYKNVTVWTRVNITNSRPEVLNVTFQDASNASLKNITINAGSTKTVYCNVSLRDWNGFNDINYLNASIWYALTSNYSANDDNNSHYTNSSCTTNASTSLYLGWYVCSFDVLYYSNNGTWICNATVMDTANTTGWGVGNATFYPVYALNITDGIDYGSVAVEDRTGNITANISNLGNMDINVTVEGYGAKKGDGLAMNCSLGGNITVNNERFSTQKVDWASKIPLNGTSQPLSNLTLIKQNNSNVITNSTYWQLYIDSSNNPGGNCTGYVIFTAVAP